MTLIVANWKMNPQTLGQARQIFDAVDRGIRKPAFAKAMAGKASKVVICPPFPYLFDLPSLRGATHRERRSNLILGAQNCFWEQKGAFTGEISCGMLKDLGCKYVIVGHSERRKYFNETNENINKRIKAILNAKMIPILCIGETQKDRKQGIVKKVLKNQITSALHQVPSSKFPSFAKASAGKQVPGLCIAYEPIWAIGTGKSCDIDTALDVNLLIREIISKLYNKKIVENALILYGGSVNSKNATEYIQDAKMDGLLIGGASLIPKEFIKIIDTAVSP